MCRTLEGRHMVASAALNARGHNWAVEGLYVLVLVSTHDCTVKGKEPTCDFPSSVRCFPWITCSGQTASAITSERSQGSQGELHSPEKSVWLSQTAAGYSCFPDLHSTTQKRGMRHRPCSTSYYHCLISSTPPPDIKLQAEDQCEPCDKLGKKFQGALTLRGVLVQAKWQK